MRRKCIRESPLRQRQRRTGIIKHETQAVGGIRRVQRQICPSRLENAQQTDDHLQRTLEIETHQDFRANAQRPQVPGQLVGALVQLRVGVPVILEDDRDLVRGPLDLLLEQLVQAGIPRVIRRGIVPLHQHLLAFGGG